MILAEKMSGFEDWSSQPPLIEAITKGQPGLSKDVITTKSYVQMLGGNIKDTLVHSNIIWI